MDDGEPIEQAAAMIYYYTGNDPDLMNDAEFAKAYARIEFMMRKLGVKKQ